MRFTILLTVLLAACAIQPKRQIANTAQYQVGIALTRIETNVWRVDYKLPTPVNSLEFITELHHFRSKEWKSLDDNLQVVEQKEKEVIVSKNNQPFSQARMN